MKKNQLNFPNEISIYLADNDEEDCLFFKEALEELPLSSQLMSVNDGDELMQLLKDHLSSQQEKKSKFPNVLFLDLNMPRKSGSECLSEIKSNNELKDIPIVIISSTLDRNAIDLLYDSGANYFIRKPSDFFELKNFIHEAIINTYPKLKKATKEEFILKTEKK
ncbi:response regulator [Mariniflexile gromovii]|uniref:Response regulator n=1 Tax=Mariniflexile gromovii TaxID=362523 RepID=A0ABS4BRF6_9FLAO|nr:response regulator [Mariniflexile gromovii]MBP0903158.1 response regulator [Mariniflexile gromovii]